MYLFILISVMLLLSYTTIIIINYYSMYWAMQLVTSFVVVTVL